jgi:hypothetical protein
MAAVLACGNGTVLSHRSAAALWDLVAEPGSTVHVISPLRAGRRRAGIAIHAGLPLEPGDVSVCDGIPCTTVARTLFDLAGWVRSRALRRAVERAELLRLFDLEAVEAVLARASGRRGAPALRAVLAAYGPESVTRSELEERFLALCEEHRLPRPGVNVWLPAKGELFQADFLWRPERLIVETDGHAAHGTRQAFERDRRRDQRLMLAGWRVARFSWRQVVDRPQEVAQTIRGLLLA